MEKNGIETPKARGEGLIVQPLMDELLVYDQQRHQAHCLNSTAAAVWRLCDGRSSIDEIAERASSNLDAPVDRTIVLAALEQLGKRRLLEHRITLDQKGASRREVMRRIGLTAAVALPLVTSIVAPTAAQAATCLPSGSACSTSAQCCSNICNGAPSGTCA
ncbi:MAG TPA: PqqD family peptide modification chaperone [Blastocatellia bacterium]|nr:PqqD family peptide modification chaperone [Blastocatellia bacterium]